MLIDGGAPYISQAEQEFKELAIHWQKQAAIASAEAARATNMAQILSLAYRHAIDESIKNYKGI